MRILDLSRRLGFCGTVLVALIPNCDTRANNLTILYTFTGGKDGCEPIAGLIAKGNNLFGTASACGSHNAGTVFKLSLDGSESTLHTFAGGTDGTLPDSVLTRDVTGTLYGSTLGGGGVGCAGNLGCGTVFKLTPSGTESVFSFGDGSDGAAPAGGVVIDGAGNMYGTTETGGPSGAGTVFKLASDGTASVLYAFAGGSDGAHPLGGVIMDNAGNLYGTTQNAGANGSGVVFKLAPDGTETILHSFPASQDDGYIPRGDLIFDSTGNLYGTTVGGGVQPNYQGTVFKIAPDDTETVVYTFTGGIDGEFPQAGLIIDKNGNLYGTTVSGGGYGCGSGGCGTVFKISPAGVETVLYAFTDGRTGSYPLGALVAKGKYLYGTTSTGGTYDSGTVFQLRK